MEIYRVKFEFQINSELFLYLSPRSSILCFIGQPSFNTPPPVHTLCLSEKTAAKQHKDRNRQDSKAAAQHYWPLNPGKQYSVTNQQEMQITKKCHSSAYTNDKDRVTDDTKCFQRHEETGGHPQKSLGECKLLQTLDGKHIYQKPETALIF